MVYTFVTRVDLSASLLQKEREKIDIDSKQRKVVRKTFKIPTQIKKHLDLHVIGQDPY